MAGWRPDVLYGLNSGFWKSVAQYDVDAMAVDALRAVTPKVNCHRDEADPSVESPTFLWPRLTPLNPPQFKDCVPNRSVTPGPAPQSNPDPRTVTRSTLYLRQGQVYFKTTTSPITSPFRRKDETWFDPKDDLSPAATFAARGARLFDGFRVTVGARTTVEQHGYRDLLWVDDKHFTNQVCRG